MLPDPRTHTHGYGNGHRHCIFRIAYSTRGYRYPYSTSNNTQKHKSKQCCQLALFQYSMLSRFHTAVSWSVSSIRPSRHELGSPAAKIEKKERERRRDPEETPLVVVTFFSGSVHSSLCLMSFELRLKITNSASHNDSHTPHGRECAWECVCVWRFVYTYVQGMCVCIRKGSLLSSANPWQGEYRKS